jgi:hypothetical protein
MALNKVHQRLVVTRLACFVRPKDIAKEMLDEHGVTLTPSQIAYYDPNNPASSEDLSEELRELFHSKRAEFIREEEASGVAHRSYRLRRLQQILDSDALERAPMLQAQILEQAARERGGYFEARRNDKTAEPQDPNAIPAALEAAVRKVYGAAEPGA